MEDQEENVNRFVNLLLESNYTIILALVESLDTSDNKNNADDVAQTLLDFLVQQKRIIPLLNVLVTKEVDYVGKLIRFLLFVILIYSQIKRRIQHPFQKELCL